MLDVFKKSLMVALLGCSFYFRVSKFSRLFAFLFYRDADKIYNPELKDILAPPSSQIPAGENFTVPPSAHSNDVHGKEEVTNNAIGSDPGAAPTATFSFPPAPSDLNNTPSDINFQPYEAVVIEQNSHNDAHQVGEQDEAFDDMVMLEDGMVTSASLSGGGAGDALDL